jgi:DNA-binding GntR family transcriptional regulator
VLVRLANEQIVTLTPNRGAMVAQPTEKEAREVFEVRRMIESMLVKCFVVRATDEDVATLARYIAEEESARALGDARRAVRMSGEFHLHIGRVADHQTLGRILRELVSRTSLILMTYGDPAGSTRSEARACSCQDHRALLGAIKLRDARAAARLMQEHLTQIESQLNFSVPDDEAPDFLALFSTAA